MKTTDGMRAPAVSVSGLTKRYSSRQGEVAALDNVSVEVAATTRMVLLGPSGCGKTTLLRCIAGLETPSEGEIIIDGTVAFSAKQGIVVPPERRGISMVFQSYALWPHMTVFENVAYPLRNRGVKSRDIKTRVSAALKTVNCDGLESRNPSQLSGGQQQRIALARAIVSGDKLVLFDEPLSNVDAKVRESLRIELIQLQRQLGFSAIYVTHDQLEAAAIAQEMVVMNNGTVAQAGTPRDIYNDPSSLYVAEFMGANNQLEGQVTEKCSKWTVIATSIGKVVSNADTSCSEGDKVKVLFRPESIQIASQQNDGLNTWQARVESRMYLGSRSEFALKVDQRTFLMRGATDLECSEDAIIRITVQPSELRIFAM